MISFKLLENVICRDMKKIIVKEDKEAEVEIFLYFLNSKEYPQHRNIIFASFPDLKNSLDTSKKEDEKRIIEKFLNSTRENNKVDIEKITSFVNAKIEKHGEAILEILANIMDYKWKPKSGDYYLVPTVYPRSPFWGDTFFF